MTSLIYYVIMLVIQKGDITEGPPPPAGGGGTRGPQLPIDDNVWILLFAGILLGAYIIYKRNSITNRAS